MLKLLKYELINTYRSFGFVFIAYLGACVLIPLLPYDASTFLMITLAIGATGIIFAVMINIALDYYKTMFKRSSYLTLTLPVSNQNIVFTKLMASVIWVICSTIFLLAGVLIMVFIIGIKDNLAFDLMQILGMLLESIQGSAFDIFSIIVGMATSLILGILLIYACETAVQTRYTRNHRPIFAIILFFLINVGSSWISNCFYASGILENVSMLQNLWINTGISALASLFLFIFTVMILNHKIEIE